MSRPLSLSDDLAGTASDVATVFGPYNPASQLLGTVRNNDLYAFSGYPGTPIDRSYTVNGLNQYGSAGPASFTYDANGNLTVDGTTTYTYDVENRLVSASGPTATTLQLGHVGSVIAYSYDNLNRMTLKDIPGGTAADVYYGYDVSGLQLYARFASGTGAGIANVYDGFGRLKSTANNMSGTAKTLTYAYNAEGQRTRITYPDRRAGLADERNAWGVRMRTALQVRN